MRAFASPMAVFRGHGVVLDYIEAYKWFSLAAAQDFPLAREAQSHTS